jgi:hypothetical protein
LYNAIKRQGVTDSEIARRLYYLKYPENVRAAFQRRLSWMPAVPYGRCYRTSGAELKPSYDLAVRQVNIQAIIDRAFDIAEMLERRTESEPLCRPTDLPGACDLQNSVANNGSLHTTTIMKSTKRFQPNTCHRDDAKTCILSGGDGNAKKSIVSVVKQSRKRKSDPSRMQNCDTNLDSDRAGGGGGENGDGGGDGDGGENGDDGGDGDGNDFYREQKGERNDLGEDCDSITLFEIARYEREHERERALKSGQISIDTRVRYERARKKPRTRRALVELTNVEAEIDVECAQDSQETLRLKSIRDRYAMWPIGVEAAKTMERLWSLTWDLHVHLALGVPDETHRAPKLPPTSCPSLLAAHAIYCARSGWCSEFIDRSKHSSRLDADSLILGAQSNSQRSTSLILSVPTLSSSSGSTDSPSSSSSSSSTTPPSRYHSMKLRVRKHQLR